MESENINLTDISKFLKEVGKRRGGLTLSILGRLEPYFNAIMKSEVGKEILRDDINRMDELIMKIYDDEATPQEKAEFSYLRDKRFPAVLSKLKIYLEKLGEIKKVVHG
jgi:hypothetical protein